MSKLLIAIIVHHLAKLGPRDRLSSIEELFFAFLELLLASSSRTVISPFLDLVWLCYSSCSFVFDIIAVYKARDLLVCVWFR